MLGYLLSPVLQIQDVNGIPLTDGKIYVYYANTSNLAETYSNYEGTLNTNPIVLDSLGHTTVIAENTYTYDITIKDKNDNLLFSIEDVAVGGEGGIAPTGNVVVRAGNNGIAVTTSVENDTTVYTVYIDYNFVASKTDLNSKQDVLSAGDNISIDNDTISVTGLKTINVSEPLQKTDTVSSWNLSIDTDGLQTTLSAGTNIDAEKLASGYIDLKNDGCFASINSIAIGDRTSAYGNFCVSQGAQTEAKDYVTHAEGGDTNSSGQFTHAEGYGTYTNGFGSHAEGGETSALGIYSHAEGGGCYASAQGSHAEGNNASAISNYSHAEGVNTITSGDGSHSEGNGTTALGNWSHAEGDHSIATGWHSHAEGSNTTAVGSNSHTIGANTIAYGTNAFAGGFNTIASGSDQTVFGRYNIPNETDLFQIGAGIVSHRKNAFVVSPFSDSISSDNHYIVDGNGNILSYPSSVSSYIDEPSVNVRTQLIPIGNAFSPSTYIQYQNISVDKNLSLPKFYNAEVMSDDYNNCYIERYETYYNLRDNNIADYAHSEAPFTHSASNTEIENTFDIFQKTKERGNPIYPPKNYFTIIPEKECGLYKIEFSLGIKGGYTYNNDRKYHSCIITPKFSGLSLDRTYSYVDVYKGFGENDTYMNRYNFSIYVSRTSTADNNTARVALTGLDFYVGNMRWNPADTYSQLITWNMRRTKIREYEGPTFVSNNDVDIQVEMD